MTAVVLAHTYYVGNWLMARTTVLVRDSLSDPGHLRTYASNVVLTVTNPNPVDASFRVEIFAANGAELTRPPGPGGSGNFDADFGFPASATLGPRHQIRFLLATTNSTTDFVAYGWARILTSLPLLLSARSLGYSGFDDYMPIVSADHLNAFPRPLPGDGTPPPPYTGTAELPFRLLEAPPLIKPDLYGRNVPVPAPDSLQKAFLMDALSAVAERTSALERKTEALAIEARPPWWSLFRRWRGR